MGEVVGSVGAVVGVPGTVVGLAGAVVLGLLPVGCVVVAVLLVLGFWDPAQAARLRSITSTKVMHRKDLVFFFFIHILLVVLRPMYEFWKENDLTHFIKIF